MSGPGPHFADVDSAGDAGPFVAYLEAVGAWEALAAGRRARTALLASEGRRIVLDVGCGLGDDVRAMADALGPEGRAVGVDRSAALIAEARARTPHDGARVMFEVADAAAMPFEDDAFDAARIERVLQHTEDPQPVLEEVARVVRPGGLLVVTEPDWGALTIDADPDAVRALIRVYERHIPHPWMGRELRGRLQDAGLRDVTVRAETSVMTDAAIVEALGGFERLGGALTAELGADGHAAFTHDLRRRSADGRMFASMHLVVAAGTAPG